MPYSDDYTTFELHAWYSHFDPGDAETLNRLYRKLLEEFGRLNEVKLSGGGFTLEALALRRAGGGKWGAPFKFPGANVLAYFRRGRMPAIVITEPNTLGALEELGRYAAERGLGFHQPPNPVASLWRPGTNYIAALTPLGALPPLWVTSQNSFEEGAP